LAQTLYERTEYAKDAEKTNGGILVRGYCCNPRTVDAEFLLSKKEYERRTNRDQGNRNIIAYHIRQSFLPGEITADEAMAVGYELAQRFTKGKHAFVIGIHIDREHIHSAIVFNSTSLDGSRKFRNFRNSSYALRRISDLLCLEHGLSVIENPKPSKGRDYSRWKGDRPLSWQEKLRRKLAVLVAQVDSFEALLEALKEEGYSVRDNRKQVSVTAPGQKRATRLDSLGEGYTEDALRDFFTSRRARRIGSDTQLAKTEPNSLGTSVMNPVSLLIDIQAKIREGKGRGYEQWARIFNLKQGAKTLLFLQEQGIDSYEDLLAKASTASADFALRVENIRATEIRMTEINDLQRQIGTYRKTREQYEQYQASGWSTVFYQENQDAILAHRAAKQFFDNLGMSRLPTIESLRQEYASLAATRKQLYSGYRSARTTMQALLVAKANAQELLGIKPDDPIDIQRQQIVRGER